MSTSTKTIILSALLVASFSTSAGIALWTSRGARADEARSLPNLVELPPQPMIDAGSPARLEDASDRAPAVASDVVAADEPEEEPAASDVPLEEKYAKSTPAELERAYTRIEKHLAKKADKVLDDQLEAGRFRTERVAPGTELPALDGSTARKTKSPWAPYGVVDMQIAEIDEAMHPDTEALYRELQWLGQKLGKEN